MSAFWVSACYNRQYSFVYKPLFISIMIRSLSGTVVHSLDPDITLDVRGVGYGIFATGHTCASATTGEVLQLHIYMHVREQEISLYGFRSVSERTLFEHLISVSGIGPKAALGILNAADVSQISAAIINKDTSILTGVSGIGKKTAEKVIIELQGKVDAFSDADVAHATRDSSAVDALKSMGYSVGEARSALDGVDKDVVDVSERIKLALKSLGK